jgi:hydroxycarboxylate dehydrogenase B
MTSSSSSVVLAPATLTKFAQAIFQALGADEDVAGEVSRHLVRANLSGHPSHGVLQIPHYVLSVRRGEVVPEARPDFAAKQGATALIDAHRGFGQFSTRFALDWCLETAREQGIAAAAIRHSVHIGRLGDYIERATAVGMVAIMSLGSAGTGGGNAAPFGGVGRFLGTNPWSIGIPAGDSQPLVFDAATTVVAEGKVRLARTEGRPVRADTIVDSQGDATVNPDDYYGGGSLRLLGGEAAGHKGYGLSLAAALLGALSMVEDPAPTSGDGTAAVAGRVGGVFLIVIDPGAFGSLVAYQQMVATTLQAAKLMPRAAGVPEIFVPGEVERRARDGAEQIGIAIPAQTWEDLKQCGRQLRVFPPDAE